MKPLCTHDTMIMVIILGPFLKSILDQIIQIMCQIDWQILDKNLLAAGKNLLSKRGLKMPIFRKSFLCFWIITLI